MKEEFFMEEKNRDDKSETMEWIKSIVLAIVIAVLIKTFIFNTTYVLGNSMYPTLHEKDRLFANKIPLYFSGPKRGEIIVLKAPDTDNKDYIKRVIGIEGDTVAIIDGQVYLNGKPLKEDYIGEGAYTSIYGENYWEIPKGYVFVLGDNRDEGASKDSRFFGPVPVDTVKGITNFRYFPLDENFGKLE